ncbi:DUF3592 domain-containing protein [Corynebacterium freiburgense]|uniref:DUF3592 domain-containing protein n=1 Tax=Corynebacterium freiburgense TaxID=556548 RepID=UPI0004078AC1|nr:DUF3592 domain-containing protein [Corynebacterium freiburgense]WJZ01600.1 hypothetical protein CFREI_01460 [Corynebacterium freiburgense]
MTRRFHQLVLLLWVACLLGAVGMVAGAYHNDRTIAADPGRALARVTAVGFRTTVDYQDEEGIFHSPQAGLLYPTGLGEGQRVWVTYAKTNPDLVKVEHRTWHLSVVPALSIAAVGSIIAAVLWGLVSGIGHWRERRKQ